MKFLLDHLSRCGRFGIRPGLDGIRGCLAANGSPERSVCAVHVAGTNGKGAVCAILDECLRSAGFRTGRYTSPHLVRLNERFFLDGLPAADDVLGRVFEAMGGRDGALDGLTYFETLTAVAFRLYADAGCDFTVLETGLGGRLDATNVCRPALCVITRIGLDHCAWLGDSVDKIAAEKAGIAKRGVPLVLGANQPPVVETVRACAAAAGAPFVYAPDVAGMAGVPADFSLGGRFNAENAQTALAALKTLFPGGVPAGAMAGFGKVVWPGRFQRIRNFIVDGAHNPPAALALADSVSREMPGGRFTLVAGFCGDKDVAGVLRALAPVVSRGIAVRTRNPRSLSAAEVAAKMEESGIPASKAESVGEALDMAGTSPALVCGSLFLAGEALAELDAQTAGLTGRFDPSERITPSVVSCSCPN